MIVVSLLMPLRTTQHIGAPMLKALPNRLTTTLSTTLGLVLVFTTTALANPVVITHFDTMLGYVCSFSAFFLIETLVFKYAAKADWKFAIVAVFIANIVTTIIGVLPSYLLSYNFAEVGYMSDPSLGKIPWVDYLDVIKGDIFKEFLSLIILCALTILIEYAVILAIFKQIIRNKAQSLFKSVLLANLSSYATLFFSILLPCKLIFQYFD